MGTIFQEILNIESPLLSFDIDEDNIFILAGKEIIKYGIKNGNIINRKEIFSKTGLSRSIISDKQYLYCKDFTTLYVVDKENLESVYSIKLGEYIDSDICGIEYDDNYIYATIRNGPMAVISKKNNYKMEIHTLSHSSIWDIKACDKYIYCGNVEGQLLVIEKESLKILTTCNISKKNLRSIYVYDDKIIIASQDKSIICKDKDTLETIITNKNVHNKVFDIVGVWDKYLITVCFVCGEIKIWNVETLEFVKDLKVPKSLTGEIKIIEDKLYIGSRKMKNISTICLNELEFMDKNEVVYI